MVAEVGKKVAPLFFTSQITLATIVVGVRKQFRQVRGCAIENRAPDSFDGGKRSPEMGGELRVSRS